MRSRAVGIRAVGKRRAYFSAPAPRPPRINPNPLSGTMTAIATDTPPIAPETAERVLDRLLAQLRDKLPEGYDLDDGGQAVRLHPGLPDRVPVRTVNGGRQWLPAPLAPNPPPPAE